MVLTRKTGTYFVEGLSYKSSKFGKYIYSKNFKTLREAIMIAKKWQKQGKIVQAEIIFTKNILSDVPVWSLNTIGKVTRYNQDKRMFEEWGGLP